MHYQGYRELISIEIQYQFQRWNYNTVYHVSKITCVEIFIRARTI